ncbi:MAG: N-formylglutamate amidohydrolase [Kordiimonadaceae bacterium]|nr:N-formylglutamate amidohydrolase [Kordiimonadaceae bacterium]
MKLYSVNKANPKTNNILYNCPHSGEEFPSEFLNLIDIDKQTLLLSGDSFVDKLFDEVVNNGSQLFKNHFGRSFIDTNRSAYELDPTMFYGNISSPLLSESAKVKLGYGSIARLAYNRKEIYKDKIPFSYAQKVIEQYYNPVHEKLGSLINEDHEKFGYSLLVDCHSMPSYEFLDHKISSTKQPDIILGDLHGTSCHSAITHFVTNHFKKYDLTVAHNTPFAGGYNTNHYSDPASNRHAIQIEIKKSLYMDEKNRSLNKYFEPLKIIISALCYHLDENINALISQNGVTK